MIEVNVTRRAALEAIAAGAQAAQDGAAHTACPHKAGGDADDRVLAAAWLRGWLRARGRIA